MVALRKPDPTTLDYRQQAIELIQHVTNNAKMIAFPVAFLALLNNQHDACILLNQILYWSSKTTNPEGWFYKSYDDWMNEIGLSRYKINRALDGDARSKKQQLTLRDLGVETQVFKAPNGNPTVHYRIDMPLFLAQLEAYLEKKEKRVCNNVAKQPAIMSQNEASQCHKSSYNIKIQTIDTNNTKIEKQTSTENLHEIFKPYQDNFGSNNTLPTKIIRDLNQEYGRLGQEKIKQVLERCTPYTKTWGYVLRALRNEGGFIEKPPSSRMQDKPFSQYKWSDFASNLSQIPKDEPKNFPEGQIIPTERIHDMWNSQSDECNNTVNDLWENIVDGLELYLDRETYNECIQQLVLVDYDGSCLTLVAPNNLAYNKALRYQRNIIVYAQSICGESISVTILKLDEWRDRTEVSCG